MHAMALHMLPRNTQYFETLRSCYLQPNIAVLPVCCPAGVWQDQAVPAKAGWPGGALKRGKYCFDAVHVLWMHHTCTVVVADYKQQQVAHASTGMVAVVL
jgi:hypothetical protein